MAVIVAAETLIEVEGQTPILRRSVSQLVSCPVVFTDWNGNVLVDVEGRDETLSEDIDYVVVAVRAVVEINAKRVLPLLGLQNMVSVGSVEYESFKIQFPYTLDVGSHFEVGIEVVANAILTFEEADLGVEMRPDFSVVADQLQPIALIM